MPPAGIIVLGLIQGALAGLNSIGFVLLWRTTRVVNLAQPALGLVGGVLTGMLVVSAGWSFWWAAPVGMFVGAGLSMLAERLVLSRLQEVPRSVLLIATIGLAQIFAGMQTAIPFIFGGRLPTYTIDLGFSIYIRPQLLLGPHILALISLPLVAWGVNVFLTRSRMGVAALALGQDAERARSLGVPSSLVRTVVWAIAGAVGSVSGILSIPVLGFGLEGGALTPTVLLLALAPAVFAGLRSIWIAVGSALLLGVAFSLAKWYSNGGGVADLLLAAAVVAAVAVQRRRLGRDEAAARASSWEAAATPRPLPWRIASSGRLYAGSLALALVGVLVAALPPLLLSPSLQVSYGTAAAFTLGALGVGVAWMFAGELPLGHWGFAGIGAALGVVVPGSWPIKTIVASVAIAALSGLSGLATRRRSSLGFAVVGLAAAAAAPVAIAETGRGVIRADVSTVGLVAGVAAVLVAIAMIKLRASTFGTGLVAARDDPQRAPWLGVDPLRARVIALTISGAIVGAAGVLYIASQPAGAAEGGFDVDRSLALLAMAVVGGISSPVGVLFGAVALTAAERMFPAPWDQLTSGLGVVAVVMFLPAGFARLIERIRDTAVGIIEPRARPPKREAAVVREGEVPA